MLNTLIPRVGKAPLTEQQLRQRILEIFRNLDRSLAKLIFNKRPVSRLNVNR